jgi:hypothetical protein
MVSHVYGLVGLMLGVCDRYGEADRKQIQDHAAKLDELILSCFYDRDDHDDEY